MMIDINKDNLEQLRQYIVKSQNIVLVAHTNPDGDAIGSCMGFYKYLKAMNKNPQIILPNPLSANLLFVIDNQDNANVHYYDTDKDKCNTILDGANLLIQLDCNSMSRTDNMCNKLQELQCTKILIDHHLNPNTTEFDLIFSKIDISSTCELVYYILLELEANLKNIPISCLYSLMVGMTTDTNNFRNSVYPSTFQMAASLIDIGVDRDDIIDKLYFQDREQRLRLMGLYLKNLVKITPKNIAYGIITKDILNKYDFKKGESEGFVNLPLSIKRVKISIFVRESNNEYNISIRSKKGYSSNELAKLHFNGGGHELAAGGKVIIGKDINNKEDIEAYILSVIDQYIK